MSFRHSLTLLTLLLAFAFTTMERKIDDAFLSLCLCFAFTFLSLFDLLLPRSSDVYLDLDWIMTDLLRRYDMDRDDGWNTSQTPPTIQYYHDQIRIAKLLYCIKDRKVVEVHCSISQDQTFEFAIA